MKTMLKTSTAILSVLLIIVSLLMLAPSASTASDSDLVAGLTSEETTTLPLIDESGKSDYNVVFSSDSIQLDYSLSKDIQTLFAEKGVFTVGVNPDTYATEHAPHEILIGMTNRAESEKLLAKLEKACKNSDDLAWGYAVINEKLLFLATDNDAFDLGQEEFLSFLKESNLSVKSDLLVLHTMTREEYEAKLEAEEEAKRQKRIEELIAINAEFTQDDFGGMPLQMQVDKYDDPHHYPADNQHPRLFFTADKLDEMYYNLMNDPNLETLKNRFWSYADAENFTGIFPENQKNGVTYRFDVNVLAQLEAKALAYAMTGNEVYGYEAIIGAKNVMLSLLYVKELHMDTYHGASQTMINVAKVYDWCYDLLTEDDKYQIIGGVSNLMAPQLEMKLPPSNMSAVSGHGTGPQFIRDWMTVSIAFYDEMPSWWEFVGGRFYQEYVPVIDYCYQGGFASQGTTTYGDSKYFTKGWAAWLVKIATGEFPYVENFHLGAYYYFSHFQPNDYYFQTGDGGRSWRGCAIDPCFMYISAALFQDPVIAKMAKKFSNDYKDFSYAFTTESTVCDVLIFYTYGPDLSKYDDEDLTVDLIQYLDFPSGTMTARNSWKEDGAAALMRIGNMTMANHDLNDHGTFQIYYKGLLAGTSGAYNSYGSYVHRYYLQSTVAHNGLLIFNPSASDAEPKCATNSDGSLDLANISNVSRYYYSGSQRARSEAGTIENWLSGDYNMADVYGADWAYDPITGAARFAYIAGDLTQAYDVANAAYMGRKMLTVFTDDPDYPMLFFTYDQMTSTEGGENFRKSFLLHTVKEPEIDTEKLTAVITQDKGRLFLHSITGAQQIAKVGGKGKAYWINSADYETDENGYLLSGKNCWLDGYTTDDKSDTIWGRLELTATGNLSDSFLTAMYVTDADNDKPLELTKLESDSADGVAIKNNFIIFTKTNSNNQQYKEFSFTTDGKGLFEYYVAGVEAGTWGVKVDGVPVAWSYANEGGSILTFTAPAGNVTLTPGKDVIGANGGKIKYNTLGGILPDDTPYSYNNEQVTPLPTNVVRGVDTFLGWYTSPNYESDSYITEIPEGKIGTITLYARWLSTLVDVDFTDPNYSLDVVEGGKTNGVNFGGTGKTGASFKTKTGDDGVQYLEWIEGSKDPIINHSSKNSNLATMSSDDECATFTITMSKDGANPMMATQFRIYTKKAKDGSSVTTRQYIFTTNTKGEVRLGSSASGPLVTTLTNKAMTLRFVMDFKNEEIRAFDDFGTLLASLKVSVRPESGAANMSEWRTLLNDVVFYWYGGTPEDIEASMRIYGIKIEEGDRVASAKPEDGSIVYAPNGGTLPEDAPKIYSTEAPTKLPAPTSSGAIFSGWYTTPSFDEGTEISEIPTDTTGVVYVYAKWLYVLHSDYFDYEINVQENDRNLVTGTVLKGKNKAGSSFISKTDEHGVSYLEWIKGTADSNIIATTGKLATATTNVISYEVVLGTEGDNPLPALTFRTLSKVDVNGNTLKANNQLYMFGIIGSAAYLSSQASASFPEDEENIIATVDENGKITVRVVVDFDNMMIIGYKADGTTVVTSFQIPESSGAKTGEEYRKTFTSYLFYLRTGGSSDGSLRVYSINATEGNAFGKANVDNMIEYNTNEGELPTNAPRLYSKTEATALPIPTKENCVFSGWYTSENFDEATAITEIPATAEGMVTVYAKWLTTVVDEDYSKTELDLFERIKVENSITYNGGDESSPRTGASFKTVTDPETGNKYLEWIKGYKDPIITLKNGAIAKMNEHTVSYEISFARNGDEPLMAASARTMAQYDKDGNKLSSSAKIQLYSITSDGNVYLADDKSIGLGVIPTDGSAFTARVVIDFAALKVIGYLADGTVKEAEISIPEATGVTTGEEFMKLFTTYVFYMQDATPTPDGDPVPSIRIESIKICEGNIFA